MNNNENKKAIDARGISKMYQIGKEEFQILKNLNLSVGQGEFISIMGPSGCGKSTLLYILGGLDTPNSGEVLIEGKSFGKMTDKEKGSVRRNKLGFIFQFYNLIPNLTVSENILLPIVMDGKKVLNFQDKLKDILNFVGLTDRKDFTPRELSGGQQQRVAIARTLITDPDIILADEPIGNLDSKSGIQIMDLFRRINKEKNTTIIQVTHSNKAAEYGQKIISMKDGIILNA
ncbi:putative ABC transport system ATP-binding protein [Kineothrix alysoides]|uniref:Putative ABC transport system ATP-binding protein n=1 Tax=Kineothrix alysoides TaxID=1469948 RepID=A0A4R1QUD9_9FIRM|nr:ABC transporter ATP-binding protein [Kineothrix alysoides]TCL57589.1 putative ABC transport system ATP-binding protein [Kineothrix alysoides]